MWKSECNYTEVMKIWKSSVWYGTLRSLKGGYIHVSNTEIMLFQHFWKLLERQRPSGTEKKEHSHHWFPWKMLPKTGLGLAKSGVRFSVQSSTSVEETQALESSPLLAKVLISRELGWELSRNWTQVLQYKMQASCFPERKQCLSSLPIQASITHTLHHLV